MGEADRSADSSVGSDARLRDPLAERVGDAYAGAVAGLGWRLADGTTPAPTWSDAAFGHTDFTGASPRTDPPRDRFAVLLITNLPPDGPVPMAHFRERVHGPVGATRGGGAGAGERGERG